jgi:hypothetical protein
MKRSCIWVVLGVLVLYGQAGWAGFAGHVLPQGDALIYEQGKPMARFQQEFPLPEGSLIACNGSCLVRINKMSLLAHDQSRFALTESQGGWILLLEKGKVNFSLAPGSPSLVFHSPHKVLATKQVTAAAATSSSVEGVFEVVDGTTRLSVTQGQLQVLVDGNEQLIEAGNHIQLAQLPTGAPMETPPAPSPETPSISEETGPGAGTYALFGAGAAGVGVGIYEIVKDDDDDDEGSPF